jgi:hypothetical protein
MSNRSGEFFRGEETKWGLFAPGTGYNELSARAIHDGKSSKPVRFRNQWTAEGRPIFSQKRSVDLGTLVVNSPAQLP